MMRGDAAHTCCRSFKVISVRGSGTHNVHDSDACSRSLSAVFFSFFFFFSEVFLIRSLATSAMELCETPSSSVSLPVRKKNFGERFSQLCCAGRSAAGQMSFLRVQTRNQNISSHTPGPFSISDSDIVVRVRLGDW